MHRRRLLAVCAASAGITGCAGRSDTRATPTASASSGSPTRTDDGLYEPLTPANECAPVADLIVENVRPKSVTVSIAITAMPERYRGGSPTPTPEETPSVDTPVRTFSDTFQLEAYPTEDVAAHRSAEYSSVPGETGWHRLEVDVKYGPEEAFSFQPPYGDESGYKVTIHAGDGLKEGKVTSRCDH